MTNANCLTRLQIAVNCLKAIGGIDVLGPAIYGLQEDFNSLGLHPLSITFGCVWTANASPL